MDSKAYRSENKIQDHRQLYKTNLFCPGYRLSFVMKKMTVLYLYVLNFICFDLKFYHS